MSRAIYRSLLWLHPAAFRDRFASEMLWLYDETVMAEGAAALLADGFTSLVRQWLMRRVTWKFAAAVIGGLLQVGVVLALSRDVRSGRALAANPISVAKAAKSVEFGGLATRRSVMATSAVSSGARADTPSPQAPVSELPAGDGPLVFAVLFGIVFVYACQRRRFQPAVRCRLARSRRLDRDQMRETPSRRPTSGLSIIAD